MTKKLSDPSRVPRFDRKTGHLHVVVETPARSRNKLAFDQKLGVFVVKTTLPAGMAFPYDFGFVPKTRAEDGDPIDVLLLMDEPAFPGIVVASRVIGVIEGVQIDGKKKIRNDRIVAVAQPTHQYDNIRKLKDLPAEWLTQVQDFFVNYHQLEGKKFELLGVKGAKSAMRLIKSSEIG